MLKAVPKVILDEVNAEKNKKQGRKTYTKEEVQKVTDEARQTGTRAASKKFGIPYNTVHDWLQHWKDN